MTDINRYLDFVLKLFFAFGLAFEVPVAAVILILTGVVTADQLANNRSMSLLAVSSWACYSRHPT